MALDNYLQRMYNQAIGMQFVVGISEQQMQAIQAMQAMPQGQGGGVGIGGAMSTPGMPHFGTVKEFRKRFKEYTKAEFREMGSKPVIKEILSCMTKLNKEEIKDRIVEHLALV